eukprot:SAG31_NODE_7834_length_1586_cov_1.594486_1_plen_59_part_10
MAFRYKLTLTKRVRSAYMSSSLVPVSVAPTLGPGSACHSQVYMQCVVCTYVYQLLHPL